MPFLRKITFLPTIALSLTGIGDVFSAEEPHDLFNAFATHCVQCHGQDAKVKGKANLLEIRTETDLLAQPELISSLLDVLDFEEMPPEDEPSLDPKLRRFLIQELHQLREQSLASEKSFIHTPIRRMNRFQYNNAVVDLFDLKSVVFSLPERMMREHGNYFRPETGKMADTVTVGSRPLGKSQMIEKRLGGVTPFPQDLRAEHGFDNRGDHLSLSPLLMEAFLKLGHSIVGSHDFIPKNVGIWPTFFAAPAPEADVQSVIRERLQKLLTRAFRRPIDDAYLERYVRFVHARLGRGDAFPEAMKAAAAAVISSPRFLYLYDGAGADSGTEAVNAFELASRLSFLLWGSLPDNELLEHAMAGDLSEAEVLHAQVTRMLKDQKLKRFCDSFPSQWLQLERIISSTPNPKQFPGFYFLKYRDSMHMMLEPLLIFETVLVENLPITQLIHSDFTYRSPLLQEAYGELSVGHEPINKKGGGVTVLKFHRLPVSDRRSGGVITNAAVMTMTSGPERTQPITRGAWLASVIFNHPPEPPPADVPPLGEEPSQEEEHLTLRERLLHHRERADCRGCHERIDPLGFALENYDPVGRWRSHYENGREVDMSGTLFRRHPFDSVVEFKNAILAEKDRFTRGLAGHLLSFALARELGPADELALDDIVQQTIDDGYRMQTLIRAVTTSPPFLSKTSPKRGTAASAGLLKH